jgi:hypothetical protein
MDESTEKTLKSLYRIVCSFLSRQESIPFREPVDYKALGLLDYPDIIKQPSDLGTIKSKLENNHYSTSEECVEEIRLVWKNCMLYNRDGSEYYHLADKFARAFEEAYKTIRKHDDGQLDMNRVPNIDERIQLSHDIFKIGNLELARVLTIVEDACPKAISRNQSTDEVLINFDALTPHCFHTVSEYVTGCVISSTAAKKTKKRKQTEGTA